MNFWFNYPLSKAVRFLESTGQAVAGMVLRVGPLALILCWRSKQERPEMARSSYVYLVRDKQDGTLRGAFTVKHEAHTWAKRTGPPLETLQLSSMRDGLYGDKTEHAIDWE